MKFFLEGGFLPPFTKGARAPPWSEVRQNMRHDRFPHYLHYVWRPGYILFVPLLCKCDGKLRTTLIEKWDARALCEKHEKTWERNENHRWPSGMRGRAFWVSLGLENLWKIMFFENRDFLIKNMIFWKSCSRRGERLTFEGRGRFWRSAEPIKIEKSELRTPLKSLFWKSEKNHDIQ